MEKFTKLKDIIAEVEKDVEKFHDKNNKSAGTRVRQRMQDVKTLAQEIRMDILGKVKKSR